MPTYGYECKTCKAQFETFQRITEDPLTTHDGCGGELRRLLYPVGIVFKGPGFYVNDYAKSTKKDDSSTAKTETKAEAKTESKPETKTETKSESKTEAAPKAPASSGA
jgi:putative FmdB family regulatory protein